ncbi:hypothetical protein KY290_028646 [Solanum tuberosum]|uniref:Uncharacterized protein n=1 Tax=Solanum tuberosum TaxID=4113 RepID=A0ABQ7UIG7_SOLTU|nr:hypothetical protein KY290_028646 [Solanum tuberosum]
MATLIQRTGFLGQNDTSIFWASPKNTGCLFLPYISMNHFKEKLALRFSKRTYAKSPVVAQISNLLALLQKIENKYSVTSKQVLVEDAGISTATVLSREISLAEENSSCVDNVKSHLELFGTSIVEHSSHVDNMFDEMSTRVFTKDIQETFSPSSFVADLDDIQSPRVFDECFPSCCPMIVAEVQPDTPNDMLDEESPGPKHNEAQLFDDCSPKDMSKRYVTTTFLDHGSKKSKIEFETFDNIYLAELENSIAQSNMSLDELMFIVEHGKFTCEFSTHNILSQFSLVPAADIFLITVPVIAIDICVGDPGICLEFLALTDFTENIEELLLLGCTGKFFFNADSNSMSRVWDPGQTWCVHCYLSNGLCYV